MPNARREGLIQRTYWIEPDAYAQAEIKAAEQGTTVSAVIRACLERYVTRQ